MDMIRARFGPVAYPPSGGRGNPGEGQASSDRHVVVSPQANGHLRLTVRVAGNGCNFLVIKRDGVLPKRDQPDR